MTCTSTCRKPNGRQAHCGACHTTFSTVAGFDHHRIGAADVRQCMDPAERGMHLNAFGVWSEGGTRPRFWDAHSTNAGQPQGCETASGVLRDTPGPSEAADSRLGGLVIVRDGKCARVGLHNCGGDWRNHDRAEERA